MRYNEKINRLELENIALTQKLKWAEEEKELLKEQVQKLVDKLEVFK